MQRAMTPPGTCLAVGRGAPMDRRGESLLRGNCSSPNRTVREVPIEGESIAPGSGGSGCRCDRQSLPLDPLLPQECGQLHATQASSTVTRVLRHEQNLPLRTFAVVRPPGRSGSSLPQTCAAHRISPRNETCGETPRPGARTSGQETNARGRNSGSHRLGSPQVDLVERPHCSVAQVLAPRRCSPRSEAEDPVRGGRRS